MSKLFDLHDRVAVIAGGGRGLGREAALALADAGAHVVVCSRSEGEIAEVVQAITAAGGSAEARVVDVSNPSKTRALADGIVASLGRVDILLNNAGTNIQQHVLDVTEEAWDTVMAVNLRGAFFCAQAFGARMVEQGSGKIINMASTFGVVGYPGRAVYAASKGALIQLTKVMALEWGIQGVNVNAIGPTATRTQLNAELLEGTDYGREVLRRIPIGRWAEPQDVAGAVVFLASPASDMVNGHVLLVDGGWTVI